jgi:serine protease Do
VCATVRAQAGGWPRRRWRRWRGRRRGPRLAGSSGVNNRTPRRRRLARVLLFAACAIGPPGVAAADEAGAGAAAAPSASTCVGRHDIADVADRVVPSVVNVWAVPAVTHDARGTPSTVETEVTARGPDRRKSRSLGSGVIVSAEGKILTNAHVVRDAHKIRVTLHDGSERSARLVGVDVRSDLAVLELVGEPVPGLRPLPFAAKDARLGELVLAIGNPFGVGQAVTVGIVSATGRASIGIADYEDFIQTDAAINPGNSGGALVNLDGELVGINTAILSHGGGNQGIGFAIPSAMARSIMGMLITDGRVSRGWLGAVLAPIDEQLSAYLKLGGKGVVVVGVEENTPAREAGLEVGDVITTFQGQDVRDLGKLRNAVAMHGAGADVSVELLRAGAKVTLTIKLGELPDPPRR